MKSGTPRDECRIESWRFTTTSALAKAIVVLLETSDYRLIVVVTPAEKDMLNYELEGMKTLGRVRVENVCA